MFHEPLLSTLTYSTLHYMCHQLEGNGARENIDSPAFSVAAKECLIISLGKN